MDSAHYSADLVSGELFGEEVEEDNLLCTDDYTQFHV